MLDRLRQAYHFWRRDNRGKEATSIILHPETWYEIVKQHNETVNYEIDRNLAEPKYRGIRIYRSLDISPGYIKIA